MSAARVEHVAAVDGNAMSPDGILGERLGEVVAPKDVGEPCRGRHTLRPPAAGNRHVQIDDQPPEVGIVWRAQRARPLNLATRARTSCQPDPCGPEGVGLEAEPVRRARFESRTERIRHDPTFPPPDVEARRVQCPPRLVGDLDASRVREPADLDCAHMLRIWVGPSLRAE